MEIRKKLDQIKEKLPVSKKYVDEKIRKRFDIHMRFNHGDIVTNTLLGKSDRNYLLNYFIKFIKRLIIILVISTSILLGFLVGERLLKI